VDEAIAVPSDASTTAAPAWCPDVVVVEPLHLSGETIATLERSLASALAARPPLVHGDHLPVPVAIFIRWLAEHRGYLLHGTPYCGIEVLQPSVQADVLRHTDEVVFATSDGLLAMYFAVVNRGRPHSLRQFCWRTQQGRRLYALSARFPTVESAEPTWVPGEVHVLSPAGFRPRRDRSGRLTEEWASSSRSQPEFSVAVTPADFPLLSAVTDHPRSAVDEFLEVFERVVRGAVAGVRGPTSWQLRIHKRGWADAMSLILMITGGAAARDLTVQLSCPDDAETRWLSLSGSPLFMKAIADWRAPRGSAT